MAELQGNNIANSAGTGAVTAEFGIIMPATKGIDFSATAGGGATSSLLDDYEEGTWSATLTDGTNSVAATSATYTKVGRQVTLSARWSAINITTWASGTSMSIGGIPYTANAASSSYAPVGGDVLNYVNGIGFTTYTTAAASWPLYELSDNASNIAMKQTSNFTSTSCYFGFIITYEAS